MNVLVVTATNREALLLVNKFKADKITENLFISQINNNKVEFLIAGVGGVFTAYNVTKQIRASRPDIIINTGIAGSFDSQLELGTVVNVISDEFGDLGFEDDDNFSSFFSSGLMDNNLHPFCDGKINFSDGFVSKTLSELPKKSSVCVNTAHGNADSIDRFKQICIADVENMEGAACGFVALSDNIKTYQIRAISNYVTKRDFSKWKIDLAIENLTETTYQVIKEICNG